MSAPSGAPVPVTAFSGDETQTRGGTTYDAYAQFHAPTAGIYHLALAPSGPPRIIVAPTLLDAAQNADPRRPSRRWPERSSPSLGPPCSCAYSPAAGGGSKTTERYRCTAHAALPLTGGPPALPHRRRTEPHRGRLLVPPGAPLSDAPPAAPASDASAPTPPQAAPPAPHLPPRTFPRGQHAARLKEARRPARYPPTVAAPSEPTIPPQPGGLT